MSLNVRSVTLQNHTGRRGQSRLRARLSAKLFLHEGTYTTILHDLSLTGAKIGAKPGMTPGKQAIIQWSRFESFGSLVWVADDLCGISFDEPLAPAVLMHTREFDFVEHLPDDNELVRRRASEWVAGSRRI